MLRKDNEIRWTKEASQSFLNIKSALIQALVLISLEFTKDFHIYSFASEHSVVGTIL